MTLPEQVTEAEKAIITDSALIREAIRMAKLGAAVDGLPVLLLGETGVGKERFADLIHQTSPRRDKPIFKVNCAAIPETLIESHFFGHEKGAFTGATSRRIGILEEADGGTVFLDEIGEMSLETQKRLLRALNNDGFSRVGGNEEIHSNFRLIAATNVPLAAAVVMGTFREDLLYRINNFPITIAPLRERNGDVELLARHFLKVYAEKSGRTGLDFTPAALEHIKHHPWPGNVRALMHAVERAVIVARSNEIQPTDLINPDQVTVPADPRPFLTAAAHMGLRQGKSFAEMTAQFQQAVVKRALDLAGNDKSQVAARLGIGTPAIDRLLAGDGPGLLP